MQKQRCPVSSLHGPTHPPIGATQPCKAAPAPTWNVPAAHCAVKGGGEQPAAVLRHLHVADSGGVAAELPHQAGRLQGQRGRVTGSGRRGQVEISRLRTIRGRMCSEGF